MTQPSTSPSKSSRLPAGAQLRSIIDSAEDVIISKSLEGIIETWNPAAERLFGYTAIEMIGQPMTKLFPEDRLHEEDEILRRIRRGEKVDHFETVRRCKNGRLVNLSVTISPIFDAQGQVIGASKIARDITEKLKNQHLLWLKDNFDSLTGMPQRRLFEEEIQKRLSGPEPCCVGVVVINLDRIKQINDALGRQIGDQVIASAAGRIRQMLRADDLASRFGGDEFGVALFCDRSVDEFEVITQRVQQILLEPILISGEQIFGSASLGLAVYPDDGTDAKMLIAHAEMALHEAKRFGGGCLQSFSRPMEALAQQRLRLANDLRRAISRRELFLQYQPIVHLPTGLMRKCEALLRWRHPVLGLVTPAEFIPLAEQTGLIDSLGDWVFLEVLRQLKVWQAEIDPLFQVAINVSPAQLKSTAMPKIDWRAEIEAASLQGESVIVEVTESMMLSPEMVSSRRLESLQKIGGELAIDDFGTGYSSLSQLSRIDARYLKIDRAFVSNLSRKDKDKALCKAIIALAHALELQVVAEGVETQDQLDLLKSWGCGFAQGFLFSRPMDASAITAASAGL